jgi:hypothetical protein
LTQSKIVESTTKGTKNTNRRRWQIKTLYCNPLFSLFLTTFLFLLKHNNLIIKMISSNKSKEFFTHTKPLSHKEFHTMKSMKFRKILFFLAFAQVETNLFQQRFFLKLFSKNFNIYFLSGFVALCDKLVALCRPGHSSNERCLGSAAPCFLPAVAKL